MNRLRWCVALLVEDPLRQEIDGLRRALGDSAIDRFVPHITLVPPVNVHGDNAVAGLTLVRRAAQEIRPLNLVLGPPSTFMPRNPVLKLDVSGPDVEALARLRGALFVEPLAREVSLPFVPHVTLRAEAETTQLEMIPELLRNYQVATTFNSVHVLAFDEDIRQWVPVADAAFAEPAMIGRGGFELEISTTRLIDPVVTEMFGLESNETDLVLTARNNAEVVGVIAGRLHGAEATISVLKVGLHARGQGVGTHLVKQFVSEAAKREAVRIVPEAGEKCGEIQGFLNALGYS